MVPVHGGTSCVHGCWENWVAFVLFFYPPVVHCLLHGWSWVCNPPKGVGVTICPLPQGGVGKRARKPEQFFILNMWGGNCPGNFTHTHWQARSHITLSCARTLEMYPGQGSHLLSLWKEVLRKKGEWDWWKVNNTWLYLATQLFRCEFLSRNRAYSFPFQGKNENPNSSYFISSKFRISG